MAHEAWRGSTARGGEDSLPSARQCGKIYARRGKITLSYRKRGANSHQFAVTDNGPGIPAADREGLFRPFDSAHDLAEGGDRLGLPICALRAEKMGGTLSLDSSVTRGASFVLSIHS